MFRRKADEFIKLERLLKDTAYWRRYRETMVDAGAPVLACVYLSGAKLGMKLVLAPVRKAEDDEPDFGEDFISEAIEDEIQSAIESVIQPPQPERQRNQAIDSLRDHVTDSFKESLQEWSADLESTIKDALRGALDNARTTGTNYETVVNAMLKYFEPVRARRIAVTETTRFFGQGAIASYRAALLEEWEWSTVRDPWVCKICEPRDGERYPIDEDFSPGHPSCRCFPVPAKPLTAQRQPAETDVAA